LGLINEARSSSHVDLILEVAKAEDVRLRAPT